MSTYNVHYDPEEMEELNTLSPFNLKKDLKEISAETILYISEEIAHELLNGLNRPPNVIAKYWGKRNAAVWVKIKTLDVERDAGKSNGYRCIMLVDTLNRHAFLLHIYRHGHGEDKNIDKKSENQLRKLVDEYSKALNLDK